jgi:CHAT domain-containing protein
VLKGNEASEINVKRINSPGVLHLATHGSFDGLATADPYLQSKLILAGADDAEPFSLEDYEQYEDGYLTAYEVTQMNLTDTRLVVLSACETGVGEIQSGEGVWGLQRAFQMAGSQNVLGSLWKISDEATAVFMDSFYKSFYKGASIRSSYFSAMASTKEKYPHPYYWGAFVLTGLQ